MTGMNWLERPHHDGSERYVSDPDPDPGDTVTLFLRVPDGGSAGVDQVVLRSMPDGEEAWTEATVDRREEGATWWRADLAVRNPDNRYRWLLHHGGRHRWLHAGGLTDFDTPQATDWRLHTHGRAPDWAIDGVCYQVFPDRFARSRDHGEVPWPSWADPAGWEDPVVRGGQAAMDQLYGGDLWGVRDHLDHVAELGAGMIWLNPIFASSSNHRYNAASFDRIDPVLGGADGLRALLDAAHERGIRVMGDLTPNHTGDDHEWFRAAQADAASAEAGFYHFMDHPDVYWAWNAVETLPELDHTDPELRRRLWDGPESVIATWLAFGLDGWRIDVAHTTGRHGTDELNHVVARGIRRTMEAARPDPYLVAEHFFDPTDVLDGRGWHGAMFYPGFTAQVWSWLRDPGDLRDPVHGRELPLLERPYPIPRWTGGQAAASMDAFRATLPWAGVEANWHLLDSHDTARFANIAGGLGRQIAGVGLQMTLPGVPVVFAGDETGATGWDHEDARRPMRWDRARWDAPTWDAYRSLVALRRDSRALRRGGLRWAHVDDDVLVHLREAPGERMLVAVSRAPHSPVTLDLAALGARDAVVRYAGPDAHDGHDAHGVHDAADGQVRVPGESAGVAVWSLG